MSLPSISSSVQIRREIMESVYGKAGRVNNEESWPINVEKILFINTIKHIL